MQAASLGLTFFLSCFALFVQPANSAEIPGSSFGYGNWSGAGYTFEGSSEFSHCAISASYLSGDYLFFSVNSSGEVGVGIQSPSLNVTVGKTFPVTLYVDRRPPFYATAEAIDTDFALLFIQDLEGALTAFKKGRTLTAEGVGLRGQYDLTGTFRALDRVMDCAIRYYSIDDGEVVSSNGSGIDAAAFDLSLLYEIATRTINSIGVREFSYLSSAELISLGLGGSAVKWVSDADGVSGTILAVDFVPGADIKSTDANDIQYVSSSCADEFASSARNISDEHIVAREIRVLCVSDKQTTEHYINKFLAGDFVIYTWFEFEESFGSNSRYDNRTISSEATLKAAKFVVEK